MNLQQFLRILRARWLLMLVTLVITIGATIAVSLILPKRYTATATVVVDVKNMDQISGIILPMLPPTAYLATQVDIIQSHSVARRAVDLLKLAENAGAKELFMESTEGKGNIRDFLAELLLKELKVEPSRESSVINISYRGNDPRFSAAVANAFVQSYINTNLELKIAPARQTNTFFNEQIKALQEKLEGAQAKLSAYQRENGIIATDERLDVENNRLNDLSSQLVQAQAQTFDAQSRQRQVQDFLAKGQVPDTLPDVLSNPVIQGLKANLTQLQAKQNELSSKVGTNHPAYQSTVAELDGVRKQLLAEMKTISSTLGSAASLAQKREDQIKASLAAQRAKVLDMKKVRDDLTVLLREVENSQRAYDGAQGRMTQTKLESQSGQTNVMVINEAVEPLEHSSPRILLNTILSIILGSMLAVGFALLREMSDRIVRSETDLADSLGIPVLGVLGNERRGWGRKSKPAAQAA
jgi:succinoglycan biosynthesis transport protein ExoP